MEAKQEDDVSPSAPGGYTMCSKRRAQLRRTADVRSRTPSTKGKGGGRARKGAGSSASSRADG